MTEPTTGASPRFRSVLDGFPAYQPGRTPVSTAGKSHKLSSNESPYAPLPSVVEVIAEEARSVNRYPDNGAAGAANGYRDTGAAARRGGAGERSAVPGPHVGAGGGSGGVTNHPPERIG